MTGTAPVVSVERDGHVGVLWLDDPERRNAMGPALWDQLPVAMAGLSADAEVRAVVVAARGPAFTVGLDLKEMAPQLLALGADPATSPAARAQAVHRTARRLQAAISSVADCPKPVVAAVHGWCIGAGVDLACACDIRLAAADAVFSVRETRMAMVADLGTLQRLPGIVGRGHVAELAFTGRDVDAERAARIGLVNDVLPDAEAARKAALDLAAEIAANSPLAVQGVKAVLRAGDGGAVAAGLDYVALWNAAFLASDDLGEALGAFMAKRPPRFTGS